MSEHPPERIELPGLTLERVRPADAELVAATVAGALDHLRPWMPWASRPESATVDFQQERIGQRQAQWADGAEHEYLVRAAADRQHLGAVSLMRRIRPGGIEIGYWLVPAATGRGVMTAAAGALTRTALGLADVRWVEIHCDPANTRSRRVAERLGYRLDRTEPRPATAPLETGFLEVWVTGQPTLG